MKVDSRHLVSSRTRFLIGVLLFFGVLIIRLALCAQAPVKTIDLARNLLYGEQVLQHGLGAGDFSLREMGLGLDKARMPVTFSGFSYQYPVMTLVFFSAVAMVHPSFFFAKLVLTLLELVNSFLVFRYSKDRILAMIYWINPVSIWWVSGEGQFEAFQNFLVITALVFLLGKKQPFRTGIAFFFLMLAVQVKLSPILLVPYFFLHAWKKGRGHIPAALLGMLAGVLPALIGMCAYDWTRAASAMAFPINYHYWNPWRQELFHGLPMQLRLFYAGLSWAFIGVLGVRAFRSSDRIAYLAPLALLLLFKFQPLVQPWYFVILPSLILPIPERGIRRFLTLWSGYLELSASGHLIFGISGWTNGGIFKDISVFERLKSVSLRS